jgi:hypothetical protein
MDRGSTCEHGSASWLTLGWLSMGLLDRLRFKSGTPLAGQWRLIRAEAPLGDDVTMEFSPDGSLTYTIREGEKRQIMLLRYRIEGDMIVTDQPSRPREERTRYRLESDGTLILDIGGKKSWFRKTPL